jgi:hypothetical protein
MKHAAILAVVGIIAGLGGVALSPAHPELGPRWFPIALVLTALPCIWVGAWVRLRQLATSRSGASHADEEEQLNHVPEMFRKP